MIAIIFDLDNVLVKSSYKKDKTREYDACVYMSILSSKKIKVFDCQIKPDVVGCLLPSICQGYA